MKTLVTIPTNNKQHALIDSHVFTKMKDGKPIFVEGQAGRAETQNFISGARIYETDKETGKVKSIELSFDFIEALIKQMREIKFAQTEPDFPDC